MKAIIILLLILILVSTCFCEEKSFRAVIHCHDQNSDGLCTENELVEFAKKLSVGTFVITNHLNCLIGLCDNKNHAHLSFDFFNEYFRQNIDYGIELSREVEIFTSEDKVHILYLGINNDVMLDPDFKKLNWQTRQQIVTYIHKNGGIAVLAHPHWSESLKSSADFDVLEIFNTRGITLSNMSHPFAGLGDSRDIEMYCNYIKDFLANKIQKLPAIIGGSDCHLDVKELAYGNTYFIGENPTIGGLYDSIRLGKTYAIKHQSRNIKSISFNYPPRLLPYTLDKIELSASFSFDESTIFTDNLHVYRDGNLCRIVSIDSINSPQFIFEDTPAPGKHIYFYYIPHVLITSPIIIEYKPRDFASNIEIVLPKNGNFQKFQSITYGVIDLFGNGYWSNLLDYQGGDWYGVRRENKIVYCSIKQPTQYDQTSLPNIQVPYSQIYLKDLSDNSIKRISQGDSADFSPWFNDNGTKIVYESVSSPLNGSSELTQLWLMDLSSGDRYPLTSEGGLSPCWRDGLIVYKRQSPVNKYHTEIWLMNDDGSDAKCLVKDAKNSYSSPILTFDLQKVLFASDDAIYKIDINGQNIAKIAGNKKLFSPIFLLKGNLILFAVKENKDNRHYKIIDINGVLIKEYRI